ncbi:DUF551 domain-containing protein [Yersinia enterocolitica]
MNYLFWISCDTKMPEQGLEVLVCDTAGNRFISSHHRGYFRDYRVGESRKEITHRQALPEPPLR